MSTELSHGFQALVYDYYRSYGRHDLPWRRAEADGSFDPYKIIVSEIMLQQTQVNRVLPFYEKFIKHFPTVHEVARSPLGEILGYWNGLGYNRRAKYLWQTSNYILEEYQGVIPRTVSQLSRLPGIGQHTAGAVRVYAFNLPAVFVETNIRTVFIHHFLRAQSPVKEQDIAALAATYLDKAQPRQWYWALMDYGTYLKKHEGNLSKLAHVYRPQCRFNGSNRQLRGQVIRRLKTGPAQLTQLQRQIPDDRLVKILNQLLSEGLIQSGAEGYRL